MNTSFLGLSPRRQVPHCDPMISLEAHGPQQHLG